MKWLLLLIGLILLIWLVSPAAQSEKSLRLYAGAGLRHGVEALIREYESQHDIHIEADYGGSGLIMARARADRRADLFLPGDSWYVDRLEQLGRSCDKRAVIARFVPVLITAANNPKEINNLTDLSRPDLRIGLGRADACQIGRLTDQMLEAAHLTRDSLRQQESLTVNELGVWVQTGAVDAAIVWDALAADLGKRVCCLPIADDIRIDSKVVIARLSTSRQAEAAQAFIDFCRGPQGQTILGHAGFTVE
jgi:molybdate transport system substrate-binding protein